MGTNTQATGNLNRAEKVRELDREDKEVLFLPRGPKYIRNLDLCVPVLTLLTTVRPWVGHPVSPVDTLII